MTTPLRKTTRSALAALAALAFCASPGSAFAQQSPHIGDDVASQMGYAHSFTTRLQDWRNALGNVPASTIRIGADRIRDYWDPDANGGRGAAFAGHFDAELRLAEDEGVTPVALLSVLPRFERLDAIRIAGQTDTPVNWIRIDDVDWFEVGAAMAGRYQPGSAWNQANTAPGFGVRHWLLFNECDGPWFHPENTPDRPDFNNESLQYFLDRYEEANRRFAEGVRSVDPDAKVYAGALATGWTPTYRFAARNWIKEVGDLLRSDGPERLDGYGLHNYPVDDLGVPLNAARMDTQGQHDDVRTFAGLLNHSPEVFSTEFNVEVPEFRPNGALRVTQTAAEERTAAQLLLALTWNNLGVQHTGGPRAGQFAGEFALTFSPFDIQRGQFASMAANARWQQNGQQARPNARGRVHQLVYQLTEGMNFTAAFSNDAGRGYVLRDDAGRQLAVRVHHDLDQFPDDDTWFVRVPGEHNRLEVFLYDSIVDAPGQPFGVLAPAQTREIATAAGDRFVGVGDLPPGQTVMVRTFAEEQPEPVAPARQVFSTDDTSGVVNFGDVPINGADPIFRRAGFGTDTLFINNVDFGAGGEELSIRYASLNGVRVEVVAFNPASGFFQQLAELDLPATERGADGVPLLEDAEAVPVGFDLIGPQTIIYTVKQGQARLRSISLR